MAPSTPPAVRRARTSPRPQALLRTSALRLAAAVAALWIPVRAQAHEYGRLNETFRFAEVVVPDLRVELRPSERAAWVLSWPMTVGAAVPLRRCELGLTYACPAGSGPFLGGDLLLEPQVVVGPHAAARLLAGATLRLGWVAWKEHAPGRQKGPVVAIQGGGLLARDGNGTFAGVGLQWAGNDEDYTQGVGYAFGLWLRAIHTTEGDRVELGLDLLQLPWLADL